MRRDFYFNGEVAKVYGVDGAVMLHHFVHWLQYNNLHGLNQHEGKVWTYNSAQAYRQFFPFWTAEQVRRVLRNLEKAGGIETGNFNRMGMDRTKWYTITPRVGELYELHLPQFGERQNGFSHPTESISPNDKMHLGKRRNQYQVINTGDAPVKEQVMLPWEDDAFRTMWETWKRYKAAEHSFKYKSADSEMAALHKLQQDSGGQVDRAIAMLQHSMANGYKGIFAPRAGEQSTGAGFDPDAILDWAAGGR